MTRPRIGGITCAKVAATAGVVVFCACVDQTTTTLPKQGGIKNQPGSCAFGGENGAWNNARLSGTRSQPAKCPYIVNFSGQSIVFASNLYGPKETTNPNGSGTLGPVYSQLDGFAVLPSISRYWHDDPNASSNRIIELNGSYIAAHYPAGGPGPWSHDSGSVVVDQTVYGLAKGYITLSGSADVTPGYLVVPNPLAAGYQSTFRAVTAVDTNAYDYSWRIDGAVVSGNNDARLAMWFSRPGTHEVIVLAQRADATVDTIRVTVQASFKIDIIGQTAPAQNAGTQYDALVPSGTPPFTYRWNLDGTVISSDPTVVLTFGPSEQHSLTLSVWDAAGYGATAGMIIESMSGGNEYNRIPAPQGGPGGQIPASNGKRP